MSKKFLRVGIILILASMVLALVLSGKPNPSRAASINLGNGQYVRDSWVYGFVNEGGSPRTDGVFYHPADRFEKITDITDYDVDIATNAMVRIDTSLSGSNKFNNLSVGPGATLTHTPLGRNSAVGITGFVDQVNYFAIRWTGWLNAPSSGAYNFYVTSDDGAEFYIDTNIGEGNVRDLTKIPLTRSGRDSWSSHGAAEYIGIIASLNAGMHRIAVNYFDDTSQASMSLSWQGPGINKQIIPTQNLYSEFTASAGDGLRGDYYNWENSGRYQDYSIFMIKNYRYTRLDPIIDFNWNRSSPFIDPSTGKISDPSIEKVVIPDIPLDGQNQYPGGFSRTIINANTIYLSPYAKISADSAGFPGSDEYNLRGHGPGGGRMDDDWYDGGFHFQGNGGSYCGRGVRVGSGFEGYTYGGATSNQPNIAQPTPLGSGGGFTSLSSMRGGNGGGFISLITKDLTMEPGSSISANGGAGDQDVAAGGHGSGGTVYIYASNSFSQRGVSTISVNGGNITTQGFENAGYEGGAGRVAVYYPQNSSIPQNVTAAGFDGAESCSIVVAAIGAPGTTTNNLSITKNTSPATVKPNETVDIILSIYNPSDSPQIVNIKDDKFYNWNTYPAPDSGGNLWDLLNVRLENGVEMSDSDITMNSDNIEFKNITVPVSQNDLPGKIKYTVTVPENP